MVWSSREVAELAGTSPRAVQRYHELGLLDEPDRRVDAHKPYGVSHLVRLLRITHLSDLGFSLPQIAATGAVTDDPATALRTLDAELAAAIDSLRRTRAELALILNLSPARRATPGEH